MWGSGIGRGKDIGKDLCCWGSEGGQIGAGGAGGKMGIKLPYQPRQLGVSAAGRYCAHEGGPESAG